MKKYVILSCVLLMSCASIGEWWNNVRIEKLWLKRVDQKESISNNNLKIDGIYISTFSNRTADFILYNNGIITGSKNNGPSTVLEMIDLHTKYGILSSPKTPTGWGVYNINGDKFTFEQWNGGDTYFVTHFEGRIIDSVTIMVPNYFNNADSIFRFYPLDIKPDSTMKWSEINERRIR